jgi:hypothetical protein
MANGCDDLFQRRQALIKEGKDIDQKLERVGHLRLSSQFPSSEDPAKRFVFTDRQTGQQIETNFEEMWDVVKRADSEGMQRWAERALGSRQKPVGAEGQFQNLGQLVDRMGVEDATRMASLVQSLTGAWQEANPRDWNFVTAVNDKNVFAERLANAFDDAGIQLDKDTISQAITQNVAPFLSILNRQAKLQVFADVTRSTLESKIGQLRQYIETTGLEPPVEAKRNFIDAAAKAIFANRSAALSRRVSGQLLEQLKKAPGMAPDMAKKFFDDDIAREAEQIFGPNAQDLINEDSIVGKVVEAAGRGVDGLEDLKQLELTMKVEGPDPTAKLDKDFKDNWSRQARAYYKDSQLFNLDTQAVRSYLANKLTFLAEGYRAAFENGVYLQPVGTSFLRSIMRVDKTFQGICVALEAHFITSDTIRQGFGDSFREGYMNANTPFAGNVDTLGKTGTVPIEEQYATARQVLEAPFDENPGMWPINARDKMFVGAKLLGNHLIEKAGGPKLPITSSLQMMGAVDQRTGLRTFMTARANKLFLDSFNEEPLLRKDWTWDDRRKWVDGKLQEQLYQATPTDQNVRDARTQFDMGEELSDEEIKTWLAANKVGSPVLATPDQAKAYDQSVYSRMQKRPEGFAGKVDKNIGDLRDNPYVDAVIPYWRSGYAQGIWDFKQSRPPIIQTAQVIFGKNPTQEQIAKTTGSFYTFLGMLALFEGLDNDFGKLEGNGPIDPAARKSWLAAGHKPNSLFGIPYNMGGLPILNTLFLYKDLKENFVTGEYSDYDKYNAWWGLAQVGVGALMRQTGFRQFQMLGDTLMSQDPKSWERFLGFLANGQINPLSGGMRQAERWTGTTTNDLMPFRSVGPGDEYLADKIGHDDPLEQLRDRLREFASYGAPSVAYLMGQPLKEEDYMGRSLRRPDGVFKNEWPTGFPGLWENRVYGTLDRLALLQPPAALMDGRLDGVLMGPELEKEFNHYNGNAKGGLISEHHAMSKRVFWSAPASKTVFTEAGERVEEKYTASTDLGPLLDKLTNGKTLYQAINGLLQSKTWKEWEINPLTTTNPKLNDRPRSEILLQPGPKAIKILHDYYERLATEKVEFSNSPYAEEWRQKRNAKLGQRGPDEVDAHLNAVEAALP